MKTAALILWILTATTGGVATEQVAKHKAPGVIPQFLERAEHAALSVVTAPYHGFVRIKTDIQQGEKLRKGEPIGTDKAQACPVPIHSEAK